MHDELRIHEGGSNIARYFITVVLFFTVSVTVIMNCLAVSGTKPFSNSTLYISSLHGTCVTPAGFTFSIWGMIYTALMLIAIYALSLLFRNMGATPVWELGGAVSLSFMSFLTVNLVLNVGWLFAWDANNMVTSAIVLLLMMLTNNIAICFAAHSFMKSASRLYEASKIDFWAGIAVLNGHNIYDNWLIFSALLNIIIMVDDQMDGVDHSMLCIVYLSIILSILIIYFVAEQTVLAKIGNPFFTHYLVHIWASVGIWVNKNNNYGTEATIGNLIIANIFFAILFLILRIICLIWRNRKNQFYKKDS